MRFFTSNCFSHLFFLVWEAFKNKTTSSGKIFEIKKGSNFPRGKKKTSRGAGLPFVRGFENVETVGLSVFNQREFYFSRRLHSCCWRDGLNDRS
ncbi:Uncharacterized protein APZ42_029615 [Daphnia magna]|uniref:Secreted protein n=1 Tax=Daphnia magna TaxID=35525 RepID=A0A164PGB3_9CRUS|nr:Uncharacterized protein APZ42_029615 [Daphnia magna]